MSKKITIEEVIKNLGNEGGSLWYMPVRSTESLEHYNNSVLNLNTWENIDLEFSTWGFTNKPKNLKNYEEMKSGDYLIFILRDDEGYEIIDSICTVASKDINAESSKYIWNAADFELTVTFDSVFVLEKKLRLTLGREKLMSILPGVSSEIFHNGYEMFRKWVLNKKLSRTKLGAKIIEEDAFVEKIKDFCGGSYFHKVETRPDMQDTPNNTINNKSQLLNEQVESFFKDFDFKSFNSGENVTVSVRTEKEKDNDGSLSPKITRKGTSSEPKLNAKNRNLIGWYGEKFVYNQLKNNNLDLLSALGIVDSIVENDIEWYNNGFEKQGEDYIDASLGHDISVKVNDRIIKLEIKTSFKSSGFYKVTRNELKEMASSGKDYFIVKVNFLEKILKNGKLEIKVENFPLLNILENLNRIKSLEVYM